MSMDFIKELTSGGLIRPTQYYAYISYPETMGGGGDYYPLAESLNLPGRGLATLQRKVWGPNIIFSMDGYYHKSRRWINRTQ